MDSRRVILTFSGEGKTKVVELIPENNELADIWFSQLKQSVLDKLVVEKDCCWYGWPKQQEQPIADELNRHLIVMREYFKEISEPFPLKLYGEETYCLNTIHTYFENSQGMIWDISPIFKNASPEVQFSIRKINTLIHQLEAIQHRQDNDTYYPWLNVGFMKPRRVEIESRHSELFDINLELGGVYLHYSQVGKTHFEVFFDNDKEIQKDSVHGCRYVSGEFDIAFYGWDKNYKEYVNGNFDSWCKDQGFTREKGLLFDGKDYHHVGWAKVAQVTIDGNQADMVNGLDKMAELVNIEIHDADGVTTLSCKYVNDSLEQMQALSAGSLTVLGGKLVNTETFCNAPFVSLYAGPDKEIMPCCVADWVNPFGRHTGGESIAKIYNNDAFKQLRKDLVNGVKNKACDYCWKSEKLHSSERSLRKHLELKYRNDAAEALKTMGDDYSLPEVKFKYLDIRFNNTCNLKCRSCGSHFSSMWHADEEKLGWDIPSPNGQERIKLKSTVNGSDFLDYILNQLPHVKEIYFAGGEPLIQDEHYKVLDRILELGLQDTIQIRYNTNFTKLTHRGKDVIDYWKQFKSVVVGASLDGSYERGEYIRKNLIWSDVVTNRIRLMQEAPNVTFHISITLSIMNAYNIVDLHQEWITLGYIKPHNLMINLLFGPDCYCLSNLPDNHKAAIRKLYEDHSEWLKAFENGAVNPRPTWEVSGYPAAIELLDQPQKSNWASSWRRRNNQLDKLRSESFFDIFPEYADLKKLLGGEE